MTAGIGGVRDCEKARRKVAREVQKGPKVQGQGAEHQGSETLRGSTVAIPFAAAIVFSWDELLLAVNAALIGIAGLMIPQP